MKQDDDLVHNYTVGKITMDCDFNPQLVPVQVLLTSNESNVVQYVKDENGDYLYTDLIIDGNVVFEPEYEVKDVIDINTSNVYKMAFVGAVYKCS